MADNEKRACKTVDVAVAGREWFGLGRSASYAAAGRGELPVVRIRSIRCPVTALDRMLEQADHKRMAAVQDDKTAA